MTEPTEPEGASRVAGATRAGLFVLFGCLVCQMGLGLAYLFPVVLKDIVSEFGWSRTAFAGSSAPLLLAMGFASPMIGALTDRFGARWVLFEEESDVGSGLAFPASGTSHLSEVANFYMRELGVSYSTPIDQEGRHLLFGNFTGGIGYQAQEVTNRGTSESPDNEGFFPFIDVNFGYQYVFAKDASAHVRYRSFVLRAVAGSASANSAAPSAFVKTPSSTATGSPLSSSRSTSKATARSVPSPPP